MWRADERGGGGSALPFFLHPIYSRPLAPAPAPAPCHPRISSQKGSHLPVVVLTYSGTKPLDVVLAGGTEAVVEAVILADLRLVTMRGKGQNERSGGCKQFEYLSAAHDPIQTPCNLDDSQELHILNSLGHLFLA